MPALAGCWASWPAWLLGWLVGLGALVGLKGHGRLGADLIWPVVGPALGPKQNQTGFWLDNNKENKIKTT